MNLDDIDLSFTESISREKAKDLIVKFLQVPYDDKVKLLNKIDEMYDTAENETPENRATNAKVPPSETQG